MSSDRSNVYIDLSLLAEVDSEIDFNVEYSVYGVDNIGSRTIEVESLFKEGTEFDITKDIIYETVPELEHYKNILVNFIMSSTATSGEYPTYSGEHDVYCSMFTTISSSIISGTNYIDVDYSPAWLRDSFRNVASDFVGGHQFLYSHSILVDNWVYPSYSGEEDYVTNYTNFTGDYTVISGLPIPYKDFGWDTVVTSQFSPIIQGGNNTNVSLFFAGWVFFPVNTDVFSCDHSIVPGPTLTYTSISGGGLLPIYCDLFSAEKKICNIGTDIYCSLVDFAEVDVDVELTKGRTTYLNTETYSTINKRDCLYTDIDLYPIKITNFSLDCDDYVSASGIIYVDVEDDVYGVNIENTYISINGNTVFTTFSGITHGYRLFYDINNNIELFDGITEFKIQVENNEGNTLDGYEYITFGYLLEYTKIVPEIKSIYKGYGFDKDVSVRVSVEDMASCPSFEATAYMFNTEHLVNSDLSASINGRFYADGFSDMGADILPLSTAYFYGKEFEVKIEAKDISGNVMEPFVINYRIQNKP